MVDRNIINKLGLSQETIEQQVSEMYGDTEKDLLEDVLKMKVDSHLPGAILEGEIVSRIGNDVIIEIGLKSEGVVDASEFDSADEIEPGRKVQVLLEDNETSGSLMSLSKRKADRIRGWETIITTKKEGDVVTGKVIRRIKGGLLVDIGVPVFLPASQVDIRKPGDISRFIGKEVECIILKIDVEGRNIVISRRRLIEEERRTSKEKILEDIEVGQLRKGVVKNIADFGVFVDLGGLDGLLHISDLSWGRISHPSEVVELDQDIECIVIGVDKEHEKISLGLKQKTSSPWQNVESNYPIGARVSGKVVNVMNYGVFIRLEDGIEGLVHISEMSWTKRLSHPREMLNLEDEIEVIVLNVNKEKQEISLGLKQTETNPWAVASQKYPHGTIVEATVRSVTNFGAFMEIEEGVDGMVHISDLSWTRKYSHPSEAMEKGRKLKCLVLEVNEDKKRISLGIKQLTEDPWIRAIPEKYIPGHIIRGKVTKLTNFGAFVELEPDLEGLLHVSELADHKIEKPQDVVKEGEEVEVKILKVDTEARKIGLSLRRAQWAAEEQQEQAPEEEKQKAKAPAVVQTVLSDEDVSSLTKPQKAEKTSIGGKIKKTAEDSEADKPVEKDEAEKVADKPVEKDEAEKTVAKAEQADEVKDIDQVDKPVEKDEAEKVVAKAEQADKVKKTDKADEVKDIDQVDKAVEKDEAEKVAAKPDVSDKVKKKDKADEPDAGDKVKDTDKADEPDQAIAEQEDSESEETAQSDEKA